MTLKSAILRGCNRALCPFALEIRPKRWPARAKLLSDRHSALMIDALAARIGPFLEAEFVFRNCATVEIRDEIERFLQNHLDSFSRVAIYHLGFAGLLWLYLISRIVKPDLIIESGSGFGALGLAAGAPRASVHVFSANPAADAKNAPNIRLNKTDWTDNALTGVGKNAIVLFDDQVDQVRRAIEAHAFGFSNLIFNNDLPLAAFPAATNDAKALPKLAFAFEDDLRDGERIRWQYHGKSHQFKVNRAHLNRARLLIRDYQRLPDLSWMLPAEPRLPLTIACLESASRSVA